MIYMYVCMYVWTRQMEYIALLDKIMIIIIALHFNSVFIRQQQLRQGMSVESATSPLKKPRRASCAFI